MENNNISYYTANCVTKSFGALANGKAVSSYTLSNAHGMEVTIINYGATITSLKFPDANGKQLDIALGFDDVNSYINSFGLPSPPYFGSVIGRYAGRISNAAFTLNGKEFKLNANHGPNTLHGGKTGFGRAFWKMKQIRGGESPSITLTYTSQDNEEHFPGALTVDVTYTVTEDNMLLVEYIATATHDTVINLTQHTYFNLDGHSQSISGQQLYVNSDKIVAVKPDGIPTGNFTEIHNTELDYTKVHNAPESIDTSFVLENNGHPAASLYSDNTGIEMTVHTNQPSVHIYVGGNCFGELKGKENAEYHTTSGICFETQNYPDAPNNEHFPNSVLKKGEVYHHNTTFTFKHLKK